MLQTKEPMIFAAIIITSTILVISTYALFFWRKERARAAAFEARRFEREQRLKEEDQRLKMEELQKERARIELEEHRIAADRSLSQQRWAGDQEREERRLQAEIEREDKRAEAEEQARYYSRKLEEERIAASTAGPQSGGYIVVDMSEKERPLFHDLLKGFEDYSKLKGYNITFSIDSTLDGRIAFKFTLQNDGFSVGAERVRQDFKDYVQQVMSKEPGVIDDLPVITSLEEHHLLVTMLKNRISFIQNSYNLATNSVKYYERLIENLRTFPALPAPTVIVNARGGDLDSRSYSANNSQKVLLGDGNSLTDNSVNIGQSFNDKQARISALDDLIGKLQVSDIKSEATDKAERSLVKVRDEMADEPEPNGSAMKRWLETAKNTLGSAALGYEVVEASRKVWELFSV